MPDKVSATPSVAVAVARLAGQLNVDAAAIRSYGKWAQTRTEHVRLVAQYLGWRSAGAMELKELDEFLLARAMEHDSPTLLFRLACEYLISARVIRPGPETVVRRVAHARTQAQRETYDRLAQEFTPQRRAELDALLTTDVSRREPPTPPKKGHRQMYNATIELAERFDILTEGDLDNRLDQLSGFHPAIGRGERGTAITIRLIADGPDEVREVVGTLIAQRANPNQVDIVNSTVMTTEEFDRVNGIEPVLSPPAD